MLDYSNETIELMEILQDVIEDNRILHDDLKSFEESENKLAKERNREV